MKQSNAGGGLITALAAALTPLVSCGPTESWLSPQVLASAVIHDVGEMSALLLERPARAVSVEPDDGFDDATRVFGSESRQFVLEGRITHDGDVDVFALGPLASTSRVTLGLDRDATNLRPTVGLFDSQERVIVIAYDPDGALHIPQLIDVPVRRAGDRFFIAITYVPLPDGSEIPHSGDNATGTYRFNLTIRNEPKPLRQPGQTVFLDFDGARWSAPMAGKTGVDAFDAADIDTSYHGLDDQISETIAATIIRNVEAFDITVLTSNETGAEPSGPFARISFGAADTQFLGWSIRLDQYNENRADSAVVFTGSFSSSTFGFTPPPDLLGLAIGNVATHELGHLLGLYHVRDPSALMDESAPIRSLLSTQTFKSAPLAPEVFPIGRQDATMLLEDAVGLRE